MTPLPLPPSRRLLQRTLRILLECILVICCNSKIEVFWEFKLIFTCSLVGGNANWNILLNLQRSEGVPPDPYSYMTDPRISRSGFCIRCVQQRAGEDPRRMVYSHCTGMGPVQGPNGKYGVMLKCSHWSETATRTDCFLLC